MEISEAELEVMKIIWKKKKATSFDIIDELKGVEDWNESTIRTLITRLQNKKAIKISEKNGKTYTYSPVLKEDEYKKNMNIRFIDKIYNGSINNMLLNFVKHERLSKGDLKELIDLIEDKEGIE